MRERGFGRIVNISGYDGWTGHIERRAANITARPACTASRRQWPGHRQHASGLGRARP
jgi:hypothetical protein